MENIHNFMKENSTNKYNFTLTFDRKKYNSKQMWELPLDYIIHEFNERFQVLKYVVVREPHKDIKYCHFHGQVIFNTTIPIKSINWFNLVLRKYGRSNFIQDYPDPDSKHRDWLEYCLKEVEINKVKFPLYEILDYKELDIPFYTQPPRGDSFRTPTFDQL